MQMIAENDRGYVGLDGNELIVGSKVFDPPKVRITSPTNESPTPRSRKRCSTSGGSCRRWRNWGKSIRRRQERSRGVTIRLVFQPAGLVGPPARGVCARRHSPDARSCTGSAAPALHN